MAYEYEQEEEKFIPMQKGSRAFGRLIKDIFSMRRESGLLIGAVLTTAIAGTLYPLSLSVSPSFVILLIRYPVFTFQKISISMPPSSCCFM